MATRLAAAHHSQPGLIAMVPSAVILTTVRLGLKSLLLHKLRSVLTMLGIIFGVCSVIAMLAIGEGASYEAQEAIKKLGSRNIILRSIKPADDAKPSGATRSFGVEYGLKYDDGARLQATIPGVKHVLPMRILRDSVSFDLNRIPSQVIGTLPIFPQIAGVEVVTGRFLSYVDEREEENVCVLSTGLAERLFPYQDPLDCSVRVGSFYFRVIGLVREKNQADQRAQSGASEGEPLDNNMYIPMATSRSRFGDILISRTAGSFSVEKVELHQITVEMQDTEAVESADPQVKAMLNHFHSKQDFEVIVPLELLRQAEQTKRIFNIVLGSIAAISLLVGGIGIMNIMLATVTERTREIGIRRALGAKKKDITMQFLVESVVLAIGGGLIGVGVGVLVPFIVSHLADMRTIITFWSVVIAFGISGGIGVLFGLYPARAAANLDPIDALRHE